MPAAKEIFKRTLLNLIPKTALSAGQAISIPQIKKVLLIRLDTIGDIVLFTPFLRELRRNLPCARITLVVNTLVYNLVEICPYVNEVLCCDYQKYGWFRNLKMLSLALFYLRKRKFDLAIMPRWDIDFYNASLLTYLSAAKQRVAYSETVTPEKSKANRGYDRFFTHIIPAGGSKHEVEHNLAVIKFLQGEITNDNLELWTDEKDRIFADSFLDKNGAGKDCFLIGLGPGAGYPKKIWPKERFLELSSRLLKEISPRAKIILFGNHGEQPLSSYITAHALPQHSGRIIDAIGKTTLRQAAALLKHCRLYIGNDSGLMHVAAAVKVPLVGISAWPSASLSSNSHYHRFKPWQAEHVMLGPSRLPEPCRNGCVGPGPHCILQVSVEEVENAAKQLLPPQAPVKRQP